VVIAMAGIGATRVKTFTFYGSRTMVKFWSSQAALDMVRRTLTGR
jgi:hypothetical protein